MLVRLVTTSTERNRPNRRRLHRLQVFQHCFRDKNIFNTTPLIKRPHPKPRPYKKIFFIRMRLELEVDDYPIIIRHCLLAPLDKGEHSSAMETD